VTGPSWAMAPAASGIDRPRPPLTLVVAMALLVALAVGEAMFAAGRDDVEPALRVVLVLGIALQLPCALFALRRSPVAAMLALLCALTALVAALAGGDVVPALAAIVVLALVARSLRWFPSAEPWAS
jgi:CDP-diglyceride synthetase